MSVAASVESFSQFRSMCATRTGREVAHYWKHLVVFRPLLTQRVRVNTIAR